MPDYRELSFKTSMLSLYNRTLRSHIFHKVSNWITGGLHCICIDIGDGTVDLLVIRKGQPDLSVRVSDRSGMAILRSEISNSIQQNYGIHLESSDVEQVLMQEATILDEEVVKEIQKMAGDWIQRIINKLHAYVPDFRTNPAVFLGGGSLLLKQQIEKSSDFKYIEFIEDIRANAVGYEKMTALHIQKRQGV